MLGCNLAAVLNSCLEDAQLDDAVSDGSAGERVSLRRVEVEELGVEVVEDSPDGFPAAYILKEPVTGVLRVAHS